MARSRWLAALVALVCVSIGGCSSDPTPSTYTVKGVTCDRDQGSVHSEVLNERVGGLVADDYVVRFSESTRLGIVALVEGDTKKAFDDLADNYGVSVVAKIADDGKRVTGFQQVRDLVASICK